MSGRPYISVQRMGGVLQPFYYDHARPGQSCMGVTDDFGNFVKTDTIYGAVDTDVDDGAHEAMWPHRYLEQAGLVDPRTAEPTVAAVATATAAGVALPARPALDWLGYQRIKRKLDAWELEHLRELAAVQAEQIEKLTAENDRLRIQRDNAEAWAESWREDFMRECEASGATPGLTIEGALVAIPAAAGSLQ